MDKRPVFALLLAVCGTTCFAQNLPRVVVLPLENRAGAQHEQDAGTLTELLSTFINETQRLNVIDRSALGAAMAARGWRMEDWADNAKTAEMGRAINARYIVRGTVDPLGADLLVSVRILDITTAELRGSTNTRLEHISEAYLKMNSLTQVLIYTLEIPAQAQPEPPPEAETPAREEAPAEPEPADPGRVAKLNTLGASAGTAFTDPFFIITIRGTYAPWRYSFFEIGFDLGLLSGIADAQYYYSLYPYVRYLLFLPFAEKSGWYAGAGVGYAVSRYAYPEGEYRENLLAVDFASGVNIGGMFDVSYTLRTNFKSAGSKISIGYTYRFKRGGGYE